MRDMVLLALLTGGCLWALKAPWVGAIMWTVVSLGSPHVAFGYSSAAWPVATAVAVCTLLGLLFTKQRSNPLLSPAVWAMLVLAIWVCITLPFSFDLDNSLPLWDRSMKIFLMLFVTMALLDTRQKLEVFIWAMVLSIGYFGLKGGLFTLATAGNYRVWGPGGFIADNNALALALNLMIPMMRYLQLQSGKRWVRNLLLAAMAFSAIASVGTYSRGAVLGLLCMAMLFFWRSDRKAVWGIGLVLFGILFFTFLPDQWWERMDTIRTYDQDASAQGRLNAWSTAWNIAKDRVFGGGFVVNIRWVFDRYAPNPEQVLVAHSVYFQMLGEHGFIGLIIFLSVGFFAWRDASRLRRMGLQDPRLKWAADLGGMVQVSMVGFAVSGAFLSLAYFDLPYNLMAVGALGLRFALRASAASTVGTAQAAGAGPAGPGGGPGSLRQMPANSATGAL